MSWIMLPLAALAGWLLYEQTPAGRRARFLRTLHAELGKSDGQKYWRDVLGKPRALPTDWCGAYILWALRRTLGIEWMWENERGFLHHLPRTQNPVPGDIAYSNHLNHHAVVLETQPGWVKTIDGNSWMGQVRIRKRPSSYWHSYYSIDPVVR